MASLFPPSSDWSSFYGFYHSDIFALFLSLVSDEVDALSLTEDLVLLAFDLSLHLPVASLFESTYNPLFNHLDHSSPLIHFDSSASIDIFGSLAAAPIPHLTWPPTTLTEADMQYRALHGDHIVYLYLRSISPSLISILGSNAHLSSLLPPSHSKGRSLHWCGTVFEYFLSTSDLPTRYYLLSSLTLSRGDFSCIFTPLNPPGVFYR